MQTNRVDNASYVLLKPLLADMELLPKPIDRVQTIVIK